MFLCQQKDGVLTAEVASSRVSHLGRFGSGLQYFYHHLSLPVRYTYTESTCKLHYMACMYIYCPIYQDKVMPDEFVYNHIVSHYVDNSLCSLNLGVI